MLGIFSGAVTEYASAGGRAADFARPGYTNGNGRSDGDELRDGVSIRHLRDFVHHVDVAGYFPRQCRDRSSAARVFTHQRRRADQDSSNIRVANPNLHDLAIKDVPILNGDKIICSRLKREETLKVPSPDTIIQLGDLLHLVGQPADLHNAQLVIGQEVDTSLSTKGTDLRVERVVVTNENVLGKRIRDLHFKERYDVVISRLNRAGVELVASGDISLQFGDILNLVGRPSAIDAVANVLGNAQQKLQQVQMLPVFIGIGLGVLLGSIPVFVPGFPAALKLGLAGGPLIMALILGRIGSIGKLYWFMPPSANLALRELGIVLFLSVVGLKSGGDFVNTLVNGEGLSWIGYGALITAVPLITVGILARMLAKMNYLTMCGMLAGSMTDPPALAFANNLHPTSGAAALSYATVYPLVMFLRIITPQLLAVLFWSIG